MLYNFSKTCICKDSSQPYNLDFFFFLTQETLFPHLLPYERILWSPLLGLIIFDCFMTWVLYHLYYYITLQEN